jgi:hypothetical protein
LGPGGPVASVLHIPLCRVVTVATVFIADCSTQRCARVAGWHEFDVPFEFASDTSDLGIPDQLTVRAIRQIQFFRGIAEMFCKQALSPTRWFAHARSGRPCVGRHCQMTQSLRAPSNTVRWASVNTLLWGGPPRRSGSRPRSAISSSGRSAESRRARVQVEDLFERSAYWRANASWDGQGRQYEPPDYLRRPTDARGLRLVCTDSGLRAIRPSPAMLDIASGRRGRPWINSRSVVGQHLSNFDNSANQALAQPEVGGGLPTLIGRQLEWGQPGMAPTCRT